VVSQLFVEIIKYELDFPMVAMGEPDPCREPLPRESRYTKPQLVVPFRLLKIIPTVSVGSLDG